MRLKIKWMQMGECLDSERNEKNIFTLLKIREKNLKKQSE
jgi:hypothetical protein